MFERPAQGSGHALHHRHTMQADQRPGDPVQRDEVGRVAHIVVGFDHQHFGEQFALGEMSVGGLETEIRLRIVRLVLPIVVVLPIARHEDRTQHDDGRTGDQDRHRPAHHARADPSIQMRLGGLSRIEHPEQAAHRQNRRTERQRCGDGEQHGDRDSRTHGVEVVQARERQAVTRAGDRQPRTDDDRRDVLVGDVEAVFSALSGLPSLVIAPHQEDAVVRPGSQGQCDDDVHCERGQLEVSVMPEESR